MLVDHEIVQKHKPTINFIIALNKLTSITLDSRVLHIHYQSVLIGGLTQQLHLCFWQLVDLLWPWVATRTFLFLSHYLSFLIISQCIE